MLERLREAGSLAVDTEAVWASTDEPPELELEAEEELDAESDLERFDMVALLSSEDVLESRKGCCDLEGECRSGVEG